MKTSAIVVFSFVFDEESVGDLTPEEWSAASRMTAAFTEAGYRPEWAGLREIKITVPWQDAEAALSVGREMLSMGTLAAGAV